MMNNGRVEHVLTQRLEDGYVRTLCGRIIFRPNPIETYREPTYFRYNHPNCQDCLRKHFAKTGRKHD
jgi:hypothetical protein